MKIYETTPSFTYYQGLTKLGLEFGTSKTQTNTHRSILYIQSCVT